MAMQQKIIKNQIAIYISTPVAPYAFEKDEKGRTPIGKGVLSIAWHCRTIRIAITVKNNIRHHFSFKLRSAIRPDFVCIAPALLRMENTAEALKRGFKGS
jgi:hypothetical protein